MNAPKAKEILQLENCGQYDGSQDDLRDAIQMAIEIIELFELIIKCASNGNGKGDSE